MPDKLIDYPPIIVYKSDLDRLHEYGTTHGFGDSASALKNLFDANERMRTALEFYANPKQYEVDGPLVGGAWGSAHYPIDDDRGTKAKEALK